MKFSLLNAEVQARKFPETYAIPPAAARQSLQIGDVAKITLVGALIDGRRPLERVWLVVVTVSTSLVDRKRRYEGKMLCRCLTPGFPDYDVLVQFGPEHICDLGREIHYRMN